jgi:hypothetical protein
MRIGGWRILYEELHNLYSLPTVNMVMKLMAGHVARMYKMNAYQILVGKSKRKTYA